MATLTVDKFAELVRKSGLVTEEKLNSVLEEMSRDEAVDGDKLAERLVNDKLITPWQAGKLKGRRGLWEAAWQWGKRPEVYQQWRATRPTTPACAISRLAAFAKPCEPRGLFWTARTSGKEAYFAATFAGRRAQTTSCVPRL